MSALQPDTAQSRRRKRSHDQARAASQTDNPGSPSESGGRRTRPRPDGNPSQDVDKKRAYDMNTLQAMHNILIATHATIDKLKRMQKAMSGDATDLTVEKAKELVTEEDRSLNRELRDGALEYLVFYGDVNGESRDVFHRLLEENLQRVERQENHRDRDRRIG